MIRRHSIPQRIPVFIGCEGNSEANYASLLQTLLRNAGLSYYLNIHDLGLGAGDPLARIELAIQRLKKLEDTRVAPAKRFVMLDVDQTLDEPDRANKARQLAIEHNITIIWQDPCFEAVLLRHLPKKEMHRPPNTLEAKRALEREWPEYSKGMSSNALARRIDQDAIRRVAKVEPELLALLQFIKLVE